MNKSILIALIIFCAETLAVLHESIPFNTWVEIHPKYAPVLTGGSHFTQGWNKLVFDTKRGLVYNYDRWLDSIHGVSIYANALISLDCATDTARLIKISNWKRETQSNGGYRTVALPQNQTDPTPADRHPYGCVVYVAEKDAVYITNGANQTVDGGHPNDTWKFSLSTKQWSKLTTPNPPNYLEDAMTYDSFNRKIIYSAHGMQVWQFSIDTEQWVRSYPTGGPTIDRMGHMLAYDEQRHLVMLFGGGPYPDDGRDLWALNVATNTWTKKADCPVDTRATGWTYYSKYDKFIAQIQAKTYIYDPSQNTWSLLTTSQSAIPIYQTLVYDSVNDLLVMQGGDWQGPRWWILRFKPQNADIKKFTTNKPLSKKVNIQNSKIAINGRIIEREDKSKLNSNIYINKSIDGTSNHK